MARWLIGSALLGLGPVVFYYIIGHRGYFDLFAARRAAVEAFGEPLLLSAEVWAEFLDFAAYPALFGLALSGGGVLVLVRPPRAVLRCFGAVLAAWGATTAWLFLPPLMDRPDFDPAPWTPFINAAVFGFAPGLWLALGPVGRLVRPTR